MKKNPNPQWIHQLLKTDRCFKNGHTEYSIKSLSHCWKFCTFLATCEVRCQTLDLRWPSRKSCHRATRSQWQRCCYYFHPQSWQVALRMTLLLVCNCLKPLHLDVLPNSVPEPYPINLKTFFPKTCIYATNVHPCQCMQVSSTVSTFFPNEEQERF